MAENLEPQNFIKIIEQSQSSRQKCNQNETIIHNKCLLEVLDSDKKLLVPQCPDSFNYMIIDVLAKKPNLIDEISRDLIAKYYKKNAIKVKGLMSLNYLKILNETKFSTTTWLKYETLVIHLIKEQLYEPKSVANELLHIVKDEIPENIASKFASVLESCVKYCREANKECQDEEEEEKWCEIIDWMSWFIGSSE